MIKKTVMIVDDEELTRGLINDVLTNEGFNVISAQNGKECLEILKRQKIDIILLDIMMPEMNGWDTAALIKTNKILQKIPIIFLTAKNDKASKEFGKYASEKYIEKPFEIENVLDLVKKILSKG